MEQFEQILLSITCKLLEMLHPKRVAGSMLTLHIFETEWFAKETGWSPNVSLEF